MQTLTLEQLRATATAGGVSSVTLKAEGGCFFVSIHTRAGADAILTKARSCEPRQFARPDKAMALLREMGIEVGQFDVSHWNPEAKAMTSGNEGRARAMRETHAAARHTKWLVGEVKAAIDDPRPSIAHDEVMAEMEAELAAFEAAANKRSAKAKRA
ncbi:hypothetical protein D3C85_962080 [compost metagenome]